jgi:hypothetical protein
LSKPSRFSSQYVVEGVLIVVSILIAFAIDAWWEERGDRTEEQRVLTALRAEFQENAERLPRYIEAGEFAAAEAARLIQAIQDAAEGGRIVVTPEQLMALTAFGSFDPVRGAFDAMLQSGELRYIRNQALRSRLVRWPSLIADAVENDYFLRSTAGPRAFDYLSKRVDLGLADMIVECETQIPREECPSAEFELAATAELSGLLSHIRGWSAESAIELAVVRTEALELIRLLDKELGSR